MRRLTPDTVHPPLARYAHGVATGPGARFVFCSGQLGMTPRGSVPTDAGKQTRICLENIAAILAEDGMTLADIVRLTAYLTDRTHLPRYMAARDAVLGDLPPPGSTLLIVSGLSRPEFLVEIEAIAARDGP